MKKITMLTMCGSAMFGASMIANTTEAATWMPNTSHQIKMAMNQQKGNKQTLAVYRVQLGDTLSGIAEAAGLSVNQILTMNDIDNPNLIFVGQLINLGYGEQAQQFVQYQGQSNSNNQKEYHVPTAKSAQQAMNSTKQTVASKPTNQYKLATSQIAKAPMNRGTQNVSANQSGSNNQTSGSTSQQRPVRQPDGTVTMQPTTGSNNQISGGTTQTPTTNNGGSQTQQPSSNNQTSGSTSQQRPVRQPDGTVTMQPTTGSNNQTSGGTTQAPTTNNGGSQTSSKPSNGGQTTNKPSTGGNTNTGSQQGVNAATVDKTYRDSLSNDYGWKGQWVDNEEEAKLKYEAAGYAEANTWSGDKNPNQTLGKNMAKATNDVKGDELNKYKYGYTHTTVTPSEDGSDSTSHSDYYFWN